MRNNRNQLKNDIFRVMMEMSIPIGGTINVEHYSKPKKSGNRLLIRGHWCKNGITNEGKNKLLNVMFNGDTQILNASWFLSLINNSPSPTLAAGDTMASHAGWVESTDYTQANRVAWGSASSTAQVTSNASPLVFDINATVTIYGAFVTSNNTKGGTTGLLWATGAFTSPDPCTSGEQLKITYGVAA